MNILMHDRETDYRTSRIWMYVVLSPCLILVPADLEVAGPGAAVPHVRGGDGPAVEPLHVAHHVVQAPGRDGALPPPPRRPGNRQRVSRQLRSHDCKIV